MVEHQSSISLSLRVALLWCNRLCRNARPYAENSSLLRPPLKCDIGFHNALPISETGSLVSGTSASRDENTKQMDSDECLVPV
jgi:hypothetical protein